MPGGLRNALLLIAGLALTGCGDPEQVPQEGGDMASIDSRPIVVEQVYDAPVASVWSAITDETKMPQWFFEPISKFEPRVGFETAFTVVVEGKSYPHLWKVIEVDPQRRIAYDWRYGGYPGKSIVSWELAAVADGTKLTLTHTGHESFPRTDPAFSREAGVAGWKYFIQQSLKDFLERQD